MRQEQHERRSLETYGEPFAEVHEWLDQYYDLFTGPGHRRVFHHKKGVELAVRLFGEQVRGAAEQHIRDDLGKLPDFWEDLDYLFCPVRDGEEQDMDRLIAELYG